LGCASGMANNDKGCYNDCYAQRYSKKYGYDFSKTVLRYFKNENHVKSIISKINKIELDFIRIGTSGDPSENWEHTLSIIDKIKDCNKQIVIITKHWTNLTEEQLSKLMSYNVCINTSISALDESNLLNNALFQHEKLNLFCKAILRIVSCDFNLENETGKKLSIVQENIFKNYKVLDTVFRVSKNNKLVTDGIINIKETKFLGKKCNVSKYNKKAYFGKCSSCLEMCGINM
jgi:hypothetical protein